MTNESKPKIADLELNKETLQDLTDEQTERARGGAFGARGAAPAETACGAPGNCPALSNTKNATACASMCC